MLRADVRLEALVARLRAAGCVFAEEEARLLLDELGGLDREGFDERVRRREAGEPLEAVLGCVEFLGGRLAVVPGVFVPRRRTELLVRLAVERWRPGGVLVDLCTGVGAVPFGLLEASRPRDLGPLEIFAVDLDPLAVETARRNVSARGVHLLTGDLDEPLPRELAGQVTLLTANAPYVPSAEIELMPREARDFEPVLALDGGVDGVELHRRIAALAPRWLEPGGHLLIETSERQAPLTAQAMLSAGLRPEVASDEELGATVVVGCLPS